MNAGDLLKPKEELFQLEAEVITFDTAYDEEIQITKLKPVLSVDFEWLKSLFKPMVHVSSEIALAIQCDQDRLARVDYKLPDFDDFWKTFEKDFPEVGLPLHTEFTHYLSEKHRIFKEYLGDGMDTTLYLKNNYYVHSFTSRYGTYYWKCCINISPVKIEGLCNDRPLFMSVACIPNFAATYKRDILSEWRHMQIYDC